MEVILTFTDNEVQLLGTLLGYKPMVTKVTEIEEEDGSVTIEETQEPSPYTLEQFVTVAIQAYVQEYKERGVAEITKQTVAATQKKLNSPESKAAIAALVEARGIADLPNILKEII